MWNISDRICVDQQKVFIDKDDIFVESFPRQCDVT